VSETASLRRLDRRGVRLEHQIELAGATGELLLAVVDDPEVGFLQEDRVVGVVRLPGRGPVRDHHVEAEIGVGLHAHTLLPGRQAGRRDDFQPVRHEAVTRGGHGETHRAVLEDVGLRLCPETEGGCRKEEQGEGGKGYRGFHWQCGHYPVVVIFWETPPP
jgi:hypothetical protein